ncbi:MAG: SUMF1/EgtB/PvdO family nonheme iron enzyme [Nitrospira sp.]|nr:SUMF1/EgtB/PvdO family nonheme iron enzyme [Nitrospira sp.]
MSKIFISHSSADNAKALALAQWLEQHGWADYFLDITPSRGLSPGERWQAALKTAQDRCEAVVFLISPAWRDSKWCLAEFLQAKQLGKPVFGVMVESTPLDSLPKEMTAEWQLCDLVTGEEWQHFHVVQDQIVPPTDVSLSGAGLAKLKQGLQKTGLNPSFFPWPPPNDLDRLPYRGLKALEAEDAAVFFGREAPLIRALDTLRRMEESGEQLFVILGASGAGKSSFLRAGLWPRLARADRHFLPLPVVRPERAAISGQSGLLESLEKTFREYKVPKTRASLRATLEKSDGLIELLAEVQGLAQKRLGPEAIPPTIVIGLDQAEELFGNEGSDEAGEFLDLLSRLLGQTIRDQPSVLTPMPRVMVLAAIRSDSYERMQTAPALAGIRQTPFNLPPLAPAEYKMVIEGPAARATAAGHKLTIEPALTEQLLQDAEGADALPLLAFILERLLIDYGTDGDLLLKEYEAIGGLQGSIEAAVNEVWKDPTREPVVPADEATRRTLLDQAFPALVTLDHEDDKPKRRVVSWSDLPQQTHPLLERLVAARVLLKDRRQLADGQEAVVVEVTHEALIRHWSHLKSWVDANREFLVWQQRLNATRSQWVKSQRPVGRLLRGLPLQEALGWLHKSPARFSADEREFVMASQKHKILQRTVVTAVASLALILVGGPLVWLERQGVTLKYASTVVMARLHLVSVVEPDMVTISKGSYQQGDFRGLGFEGEQPVRQVTIKSFAIGKYEVTFQEYDRYTEVTGGRSPSHESWGREKRPVILVSWDDAVAYAKWLSHVTGKHYRLPTESEWEYAARSGGNDETWAGTSDEKQLADYAVYDVRRTEPVGSKKPNGFGLSDMSGNVYEWVEDCWHESYKEAPTDGSAWLEANGGECGRRVVRGGSWNGGPVWLRTSTRYGDVTGDRLNDLGFRLVQDIP